MPGWVFVTLVAALFQTWRTALQQRLRGTLSLNAAAVVRYLYGVPFGLLILGTYWAVAGGSFGPVSAGFVGLCALAGLAQIFGTNLLISSFGPRGFAVGTAYAKTEAVQAVAGERIADENIHVGPSDYVAWQNDNKVCFLRMEGELFGGVPMNLELRLSVEDSPNSAGVAIDMIRCAAVARDRGLAGPVLAPAAYFCKHPPRQMTDDEAYEAVEAFIAELPLAAPAS